MVPPCRTEGNGYHTPLFLKFPAQISIAFALPFQLELTLLFALFFQLSQLFNPRIGPIPPNHLLQPVADSVRPSFMAGAICPKITPRNAR